MNITTGGSRAASARRLGTARSRFIAFAAIAATLVTGTIVGVPSETAWATDYPTWNDVAAVRNDEAATKNKIAEIEALLSSLQAEAARTQADAEAKGTAWGLADSKFQDAALRTTNLQTQADTASAKADASELRAGQWAAQLARSGGTDMTANLFANAKDADNLLYGLGMSSKISGQAYAIYEAALLDRNTAQALTDQATVARNELEVLKVAAEKAFAEAQVASQAAAAAVEAQLVNQATLQQQLIVLKDRRAAVETDYLAGVAERLKAAASIEAGEISQSGWARPSSGWISDYFGWRVSPGGIGSTNHQGIDLGVGCGQNIFAASSGTVVYAGYNGGYGNFVLIDHGNGIQTAYGHIQSGGILVSYGQWVGVGTNIAKVGSTGNSTGCHLHFEVRSGGVAINPIPFMADQGISFG